MPPYLATTKTSIVVQDFKDVEDETTLRELHEYLFRKHNLLEKVIRARKLHHSHFFAIDNDYGHEKYLNQLQNEKHVMARALEKLGQRGTTLMYQQVILCFRGALTLADVGRKNGSTGSSNATQRQRHSAKMKAVKSNSKPCFSSDIKRRFNVTNWRQRLEKPRNAKSDSWRKCTRSACPKCPRKIKTNGIRCRMCSATRETTMWTSSSSFS